MKKIFLFLSSIVFWVGNGFSQILQFEEVPDSLNPFLDFPLNSSQVFGLNMVDLDDNGDFEIVLFPERMLRKDPFGEFQSFELEDTELATAYDHFFNFDYTYYFGYGLHYADIDSDRDTDYVMSYYIYSPPFGDECSWQDQKYMRFYKNNGNQEFEYLSQENLGGAPAWPSFIDVDSDGDLDLIRHSSDCKYGMYTPSHELYENFDNTFDFIPIGIQEDFEELPQRFQYYDLDSDGDRDAFYAAWNDGEVNLYWKERTGANSFASDTIAPINWDNQPTFWSSDFGDFDNDGLIEYAEYDHQLEKIRVFKEVEMVNSIENIEDLLESQISIYPNPAMDFVSINTDLKIKSLEIFNSLGQKMRAIDFENRQIDVSTFSKGLYFFVFRLEEGTVRKRVVKN